MNKYPTALVSDADMPQRADGTIIYSQHMNAVQSEVIEIEKTLGLGVSDDVPSLLEGGHATLAERLGAMTGRLNDNDRHRSASSNVHGIFGSVVGTSDAQTLTNKTLIGPRISGAVDISNTTFGGPAEFHGSVVFRSHVTLGDFSVASFSNAQHNHTDERNGGRIPPSAIYDPSSGKTLEETLDAFAKEGHKHARKDITDFRHELTDHSGTLPVDRISGLGSAAGMSVPDTAGAQAGPNQLVRGDDPRLKDARTPTKHAATHAATGSDPLSPAAIGAAPASHTHTKSQITDFSHDLGSHTGHLNMNRVYGLETEFTKVLYKNQTAANSYKVNGKRISVQKTAPASPSTGDVWISY